ncbi:MAG TPA: hypothetical protein VHM26_09890 [Chitinophagaceae bacterium]|jgi:hypothetical protein|nr:hypothetical protein [Chitinophagaceae bacterium]
MRTILSSLLLSATILIVVSSCTHRGNPHGLPPGQAKKVTGSKSAKAYAPGQQKKRN